MQYETPINDGAAMSNNGHDKKMKDGRVILGNPEITRPKSTPKQTSLPTNLENVNPLSESVNVNRNLRKLRNTISEPSIFVTPAQMDESTPEHVITFPKLKGANRLSPVNQLYGRYKKKSSQDFTNPAFESDEGYLDDHQFSDIVDQVLRQPLNGQYVHPYGQGNLYKAILIGEKTKVPQNAGKLVFWAVFMLLMAGIACTIIILAETHESEPFLHPSSKGNTSSL